MPRKKAAPPQASTNGDDGPSSPADETAADVSSVSNQGVRSSVAGGGDKPPQGGILTESMQKQMAIEGIEAFELPRAVVTRVAKAELPDAVQIRKDAILAVSKSATIFISYLAAVADELAKQGSRKTIATSDVLDGLSLMEFPQHIRDRVKKELKSYRALQDQTKKDKQKPSGSVGGVGVGEGMEDGEEDEEEDEGDEDEDEGGDAILPSAGDEEQTSLMVGEGEEGPPATTAGEQDVDEEDEDTEQKMVEAGADEGQEEDEHEDEDMADEER